MPCDSFDGEASCWVDVKPWELAVLELRTDGADDLEPSDVALVLRQLADIAVDVRTPLVAAVRHHDGDCLVLPWSAAEDIRKRSTAKMGGDEKWVALQAPCAASVGLLSETLAEIGVETLALGSPGTDIAHALIRVADLLPAAAKLVDVGCAVGPASRFHPEPQTVGETSVRLADVGDCGVFGREEAMQAGSLPSWIRFQSSLGPFVDIRIPMCAQVNDASSCGVRTGRASGGMPELHVERRTLVSFRPPSLPSPPLANVAVDEQAGFATDASGAWHRLGVGDASAVLELVHGPDTSHRGLWIFAGGFFGRVTGLALGTGLTAGYCCRDEKQLRHVHGASAVDAELQCHFNAVLGKVERPGHLRILRRSWSSPATAGHELALYDAESGVGGKVHVNVEAGLVVHRLPDGGEQRWRILSMADNPFGENTLLDDGYNAFGARVDTDGSNGKENGLNGKAKEKSPGSPSIHFLDASANGSDRDGKETSREKTRKDKRKRHDCSSDSCSRSPSKDRGRKSKKERHKNGKSRSRSKKKAKDRDNAKERDRKKTDRSESRVKKKGKDKDRGKSDESAKDKDKDRKKKQDRSVSGRKQDKDRKRRDNRSKSSRKKGKESRSRSKKKHDKDRSRSKSKKKDRERDKDRGKEKDRDRESEKDRDRDRRRDRSRSGRKHVSPVPSTRRPRGGGFDSRDALPESVAPTLAGRLAIQAAQAAPSLTDMLAKSVPGIPTSAGGGSSAALGYGLPLGPYGLPGEPNPEVEAFLALNPVEPNAAQRLRMMPRQVQRSVLERGSLHGAREPSAVLNSRIRDAMGGAASGLPALPGMGNGGIEGLIARYNLDAQCAQQLRNLPLHLQSMAAELPVHEARNPSAFVMAQLQHPRFRQAQPPPIGGPCGAFGMLHSL